MRIVVARRKAKQAATESSERLAFSLGGHLVLRCLVDFFRVRPRVFAASRGQLFHARAAGRPKQ